MMRSISVLIALVVLCQFSFAQKENNQWRFTSSGAIDFNGSQPVGVSGAAISTVEGSASIASPDTGELLFYTNGVTVWNALDEVMPNGNDLLGGSIELSSTTAAVIVPRPGNDQQFYIFCIDEQFGSNGLTYSLLDMSLESGLGDIVSSEKNISLYDTSSEKLQYVPNATNDGYWVVTHGSSNPIFIAFEVTSSGVNLSPVISNAGLSHGNGSGYMKINGEFNKVVQGNLFEGVIELFDFDNSSGVVTEDVSWNYNFGTPQVYGVEFSPNSNLIYTANLQNLVQYDISSGIQQTIEDSGVIIEAFTFASPAGMQIGPDDKIYLNYGTIGVINCPNLLGLDCGFEENAVPTLTGGGGYGLPTKNYFLNSGDLASSIISSDDCSDVLLTFTLTNFEHFNGIDWDFGDGTTMESTSNEVTHIFQNEGEYIITASVQTDCGIEVFTNTFEIINCVDELILGFELQGDTCNVDQALQFVPVVPNSILNVTWNFGDPNSNASNIISNDGVDLAVSVEHQFTAAGTYAVCLTYTDNSGLDTTICQEYQIGLCCEFQLEVVGSCSGNETVFYIVGDGAINNVQWTLGDGGAVEPNQSSELNYIYSTAGLYNAEVSFESACGIESLNTEVQIDDCTLIPCDIFIPNVFTPNNDNLNERFQIVLACIPTDFELTIFNRWGQVVFESEKSTEGWNGGVNGYYAPDGVYAYIVQYKDELGLDQSKSGSFTLLR
jgi:gliding motility-associated-like protein